jgi:preprotein translocase subunit SecG
MLLGILLTIQIVICVALVLAILLQKSEGGALGMGGGPSGFMTARGAGNLLTRTTAILATAFFVVSVLLTIVGNMDRKNASVVDRIKIHSINPVTAPQPAAPAPAQPGPAAPSQDSLDALTAPTPQVGAQPNAASSAQPANPPAPKK